MVCNARLRRYSRVQRLEVCAKFLHARPDARQEVAALGALRHPHLLGLLGAVPSSLTRFAEEEEGKER